MEDQAEYSTYSHDGNAVSFKHNYNNKLACDYFTSIRLMGTKYQEGKVMNVYIWQNGTYRKMFQARVLSVKPLLLHQISDTMAYIDSGMDALKIRETIYYMYKDRVPDVNTAQFCLIMFERIRNKPSQGSLFGE
jgi:uncharacterized protein YqfB (UPF0267 family)